MPLFLDGYLHNDPTQRFPRVPTIPNPKGKGSPCLDLRRLVFLAMENDGVVIRYHLRSVGPRITQLRIAMIDEKRMPVRIERVLGMKSGYLGIFPTA